ncbi:Uncharacterised protein [Mycobacteroides abscessus subsp. abscessus]|nr:Uncharacterised protein [Mycobacteroides abscessus subsp. abscessus]SKU91310.1 Uncharacterised protein [Mycobacteroides abscessus subsp. abscessus]SKV27871.1 Uncharacterised protein [Mycobacteroides abscessus subsp. abscessus]
MSCAAIAIEMPVFPLVGSRIVAPGSSNPSCSACSIMRNAGRSLMDPVGLRSSSLAHNRTCGEPSPPESHRGDSLCNPTSGVFPSACSSESYRVMRC